MRLPARTLLFLALPLLLVVSACRDAHVNVTVENQTGASIDLLEVDYPSASFGADSLAAGASYHYLIQVRLDGPVKVQYSEHASHKLRQMTGPDLHEGQQGQLEIVLLPDGKAEFHPQLTPQQ